MKILKYNYIDIYIYIYIEHNNVCPRSICINYYATSSTLIPGCCTAYQNKCSPKSIVELVAEACISFLQISMYNLYECFLLLYSNIVEHIIHISIKYQVSQY